jgi:hypothetical protein
LILNHTKKEIIVCDRYFAKNKWVEHWEGHDWDECVHPLPLLTCSANHSGGSYYGVNKEECGTWFNDEIEVVLDFELSHWLKEEGYVEKEYEFRED